MGYVLGIDLGTSAVKVSVIDKSGEIIAQQSKDYALYQPKIGYSEQNPEDWVTGTTEAIINLSRKNHINLSEIKGVSYSGQMHGLVLVDNQYRVLRPAILWNDTRTTSQRREIMNKMGDQFIQITHNLPLEGFTLPKLLWIKENEPAVFKKIKFFMLPKDYLRYKMTGKIATDYSDAAGTVLLDADTKEWSEKICKELNIPFNICPPIYESSAYVGNITRQYAQSSGLSTNTSVFVGAADNAAGAVGAGILQPGKVLCSIGTSGVVLKYEETTTMNYHGKLHVFNHAIPDRYYTMGVTLAAGYSLTWLKRILEDNEKISEFIDKANESEVGANGLLFTPYIAGERSPHDDADIRGSFIGLDGKHRQSDLIRAVMEGIVFSFEDVLHVFQSTGSSVKSIISIGGGARSSTWLQMQADIFNIPITSLKNEQGPGLGAAMIAAIGVGWFDSFQECAENFVQLAETYKPIKSNVTKYKKLYDVYRQIYSQTANLSHQLIRLRQDYH